MLLSSTKSLNYPACGLNNHWNFWHTLRSLRELRWDKILAWLYYIMGLLDFYNIHKILFCIYLTQSSVWPPTDVQIISCTQYPSRACLHPLFLYYNLYVGKAETSGLNYKHITILNYDSTIIISLELHLLTMLESSFKIIICL